MWGAEMKHLFWWWLGFAPLWAGYPVVDLADYPLEMENLLLTIEEVAAEVEQYQAMEAELRHHHHQAQKLVVGFQRLGELDLRALRVVLQHELFADVMGYHPRDPNLVRFLEMTDGIMDLRGKLGLLQARFRTVFNGLKGMRQWQVGRFRLDQNLMDLGDLLHAQHEHEKAAVLQAAALWGESKYGHQYEGDKWTKAYGAWRAFQDNRQDLRGEVATLDMLNAGTYALRETQHQRLRALGTLLTLLALAESREAQGHEQDVTLALETLTETRALIEAWQDIHRID